MPKVSVIVPAYNQAKYLKQTLNSVLNQTYNDWECVIVNDGSTDNTAKIAKNYVKKDKRFKYIYQKNKGLAGARNTGIKTSQGEYIGFLDSDDLWKPSMLEKTVTFLAGNHKTSIVSGAWSYVDKNGKLISRKNGPAKCENYLVELLFGNLFPVHALLIKKAVFIDCGFFDSSLPSSEDWDMWLRVANKGYRFNYVNDLIAHYRIHNNTITSNNDRIKKGNFSVLDKFFTAQNNHDIKKLKPRSYILQWIHLAEVYLREEMPERTYDCIKEAEKISLKFRYTRGYSHQHECLSNIFVDPGSFSIKEYSQIMTDWKENLCVKKYFKKEEKKFYIYILARYYEIMGKINNANKLYMEILKKDRSNDYIRLLAAKTYTDMEKFPAAIREVQKILVSRNVPNKIRYYLKNLLKFEKALMVYKNGNVNQAILEFRSVLKNRCQNEGLRNNVLFYLAMAYRKGKKLSKALRAFKRLLEKGTDDMVFCARVHYHHGSTLKEAGLFKESKKEFKKVFELLSKNNGFSQNDLKSGAHFHLGTIFKKNGDTKFAKKEFLSCLRLNPEHQAARDELKTLAA